MARLNIEECWWSDPRRDLLRRLLGTENQDQVAIQSWRLAQEYWIKGALIPWDVFITLQGAKELVKAGLARIHESSAPNSTVIRTDLERPSNELEQYYVYVRGSSERCASQG